MKKDDITNTILKQKLIAIIRLKQENDAPQLIKMLIQSGVKALEITSNTPGYLEEIKKARKQYPNVLIGAGTVTNTEIALLSISAGSQFLVTPNTNPEIVSVAHKNNIPVIMGALTPTEITQAIQAGADIIKLFPAGTIGIDYFKALKGPFSNTSFFAVGGINLNNAKEWLNAGLAGIGVGSALTQLIKSKEDEVSIKNIAQQYIEILKH